MIRSRVATPALAVLASFAALSPTPLGGGPAFASATATTESPAADQILVTGTGEVSGEPDTLTAEFAVETTASTVGQALDNANIAATRMRDTLVHAGIARADLQTANVSIGSKVNGDQTITGYTVSQGLTAKIRNLQRAGKIMSAAISAGGDAARLNGVSFAIENNAALLAEARRKAFADARRKAELYAGEAGRSLGRVRKVCETDPGYGGNLKQYDADAMASSLPIEPGQQRLSVTVTVEWALDPAQPRIARRSA